MNALQRCVTERPYLPKKTGCTGSLPFVTAEIHQFAEALGNAIDAKDTYTCRHSEEVAEVSHLLALSLGLSTREADIIHVAGHLHDIGKIGVPDLVLRKRGPLDDLEWQAMRQHSQAGAGILRPVAALNSLGIVDMVLHHHERFDGQGYPDRLKGTAIPVGARIITLADSLSAMLQNRPYRLAKGFVAAQQEIVRCSGNQFDPAVVTAFVRVAEKIRNMMLLLERPETG